MISTTHFKKCREKMKSNVHMGLTARKTVLGGLRDCIHLLQSMISKLATSKFSSF